MEKKEFHKANLPHFQVPGQSFFVTWNLKDAIPAKALKEYTSKLEFQKNIISNAIQQNQSREQIDKLKFEYNLLRKKMIKAFDDYMHLHQTPGISLSTQLNTTATLDALLFWEDKKLKNYAICIMPNHVHWVFHLFEKDENGNTIWLENILKSVKQFSSTQINTIENHKGSVWHKESWDTTIRDDRHLYEAIEYTKNNPVVAGLVKDWRDWKGTIIFDY